MLPHGWGVTADWRGKKKVSINGKKKRTKFPSSPKLSFEQGAEKHSRFEAKMESFDGCLKLLAGTLA